MPEFDAPTRTKIESLRTLRVAGAGIEAFELVKVAWPAPDGDIYYSVLQTDEIASVPPPVTPIETRLIPEGFPNAVTITRPRKHSRTCGGEANW